MSDKDYFIQFIDSGNFSQEAIEDFKKNLSINNKQFIRKSFKFLTSEIKIIKNNELFNKCILNAVILIGRLCDQEEFNEEEVIVNRKRIKTVRESLLYYSKQFNNMVLLDAANKLDEIVLDKNINVEDLIKLIKALINKKEDINIIKKLLNTNKGAIILDNNKLFDYVFYLSINAMNRNNPDIYYYITLLKIFYSSKINKKKYSEKLNSEIYYESSFASEVQDIIYGKKRSLSTEEIINKYGIVEEFIKPEIVVPNSSLSSIFTFTLDSNYTKVKDDAITLLKDGDKYIVKIHIADPTHYIKPESQLDLIARNNYKNLYLSDKQIKMFDNETASLLSLDRNQSRNVITLNLIFNSNYEIEDCFIEKDVIHIDENIGFADADYYLNAFDEVLTPALRCLYDIACELEKQNPSKRLYWEKKNSNSESQLLYNYRSDKIIQELMVLYNYEIPTIACENSIPFVYRTQEKPYLENTAKKLNITLDDTSRKIIQDIYLTSKYSDIPKYHNGINLPIYSHSSNPLRRYPDLYNLYLLHHFYFNDLDMDFIYVDYLEMIKYFNERNVELSLMRSEYERAKLLKKD